MFKDVKFYSCIGNGGLINTIIYSAPTGSLFLTNYRIIYKPSTVYKNDINFWSFNCSLGSFSSLEKGSFHFLLPFEIAYLNVKICANDSDQSNKIFFKFLEKLTANWKMKQKDSGDETYYYSDVLNQED